MATEKFRSQDTKIREPTYVKFAVGGISGMVAQAATHPMDVIKIRMQVSKSTIYETLLTSVKDHGISGLYKGLTAALLRQMTYTSTRLGIYNTLNETSERHFGSLSYPVLVSLGMISGIVGSFVGTPADVVMVRMIADIQLPSDKRRNYKNAISGLKRIVEEEGITKVWRGALPTMGRAAIVNGAQLGTYSRAKRFLSETGLFREGLLLQFNASMISGLVTALASLPVDTAKTRIQHWKGGSKPPSTLKMILIIVKAYGVSSLWRGFLPYYARIGPNTVLTMLCMDQLTRLYIQTLS